MFRYGSHDDAMDDARHLWKRARAAANRARSWPDSEGKTFFTTIAHTYMKMAMAAERATLADPAANGSSAA